MWDTVKPDGSQSSLGANDCIAELFLNVSNRKVYFLSARRRFSRCYSFHVMRQLTYQRYLVLVVRVSDTILSWNKNVGDVGYTLSQLGFRQQVGVSDENKIRPTLIS